MNKTTFFSLLFLPLFSFAQISLNQVDNFENFTTQNWTKGNDSSLPNQNISSGGPNGADDNFLRVESTGGSGADSKLVTFNNAQWLGDYVNSGVSYISMDVRNSGSNLIQLRLAFENSTISSWWGSTNAIAVAPGQGWQTIVFPIDENSLTRLINSDSYNDAFSNITEVRILHNDIPDWRGDTIAATLDIDNIQATDDDMGLADTGLAKISLGLIDDFEGLTTENWTKGNDSSLSNQNIGSGGPNGADDNFLRVESTGGSGADSKLVSFNNAQWLGDYVNSGVSYISMDVRNSGSNLIQLRLAFENSAISSWWGSTNAIAVVPGQGWQTIVFPVDENSLTRLINSDSYNDAFSNITEVRILHNDTPDWRGDVIAATLDIDNIQATDDDMGLADAGLSKISIGLIDDFEGLTTENWTKGNDSSLPNQNMSTGGPDGADDNFLRVESTGGSGADSKLVSFNNAQWLGDYVNSGVSYISMNVRNSGSNLIQLRLAFENSAISSWWGSTNAIAVVPGQGWQTIVFPIDENSLTRLINSDSYNDAFSNITEVRILHNDTPDWRGDAIEAILDMDNIQASDQNLSVTDAGNVQKQIRLFPNPSSDYIQIEKITEEKIYIVLDVTGKTVLKGKTDSLHPIDIRILAEGTYFLRLDNVDTFRFVKN